ncbi:MAG: VWA domain-containing protein [Proteobacteria bacterium]|nr:VWA domain-containing protein [Cystobacterineae bacterium]MCL2313910.1 VWA domain-containing protein [Pseudomonadota bacterium]
MPTLHFHSPLALWLLLLLPLALAFGIHNQRKRTALRFASNALFSSPTRGLRAHLVGWLPLLLQMLSLSLAMVALARPQVQERYTRKHTVEGIDVMIALDLSTSMKAADFKPLNRINVAKQVLSEFIEKRGNDRIGLVVFAGSAYTQVPLTLDYGILKQIVGQLETGTIQDGTAIGDALASALLRLRKSEAKSKVIVLITDGDNNAGRLSPLDAAQLAASYHIPIYTILVGKGGKVPFPRADPMFGVIEWIEIEIPTNPALLENVASISGGMSYLATDKQSLEQGLQNALNTFERSKLLDGTPDANYAELFGGFLLAAFLLMAAKLTLQNGPLRVLP